MAKIEMQGMEEYIRSLERLGAGTEELCKAAVYAGADVVADEVRQRLASVKTVPDKASLAGYRSKTATYINETQKKALLDSMGVAKISTRSGVTSTKVGFDGYNSIKTKAHPGGQPNALIARACESGSVAMLKQPFMRPAEKAAEKPALEAMEKAADKKIKELTGE